MNSVKENLSKTKNANSNTNAVKTLISHIKVMYYNCDPMLASVEDVSMLYNALCDLDEIVGMYEVKDSIVKQIKFLLVNHTNDNKNKFENHMLHTVVFGPPGVGKTTVGSCLANIWKGLGLIEKKKLVDKSKQQTLKNIRILPIPIFLMKDKQKEEEYTNSECKDSKYNDSKCTDEQYHFNIKSYIEEPDDVAEPKCEFKSELNQEKKYNSHILKYKKKPDVKEDQYVHYKIKELKEEMDALSNREKDSVDDKRKYVKELAKYRRKVREIKLLSSGVKAIMRTVNLSTTKPPLKRSKIEAPIKIVSRPDFVGQYVGHTCDKTQKLLTTTLEEGKVLFIDEAYSLVLDEKDSFGHEAINEINRFMSENPQLVVIFAGYKDKMESSIFRTQPGLFRRCSWNFEISDYTNEMLSNIFMQQLTKDNWTFEGKQEDLNKFFQDKIKNFGAFGGDTLRLSFYCKLKYSELKFDYNTKDKLKHRTITFDIVKSAYTDMYCLNKPEKEERQEVWRSLYN